MSIGLFFQISFGLFGLYFLYEICRALWTGTLVLGRELSAGGAERAEYWFGLGSQVLFLLLMLSWAWGFGDSTGRRIVEGLPHLMLLVAVGGALTVAENLHRGALGNGQLALDRHKAPVRFWFLTGVSALTFIGGLAVAAFLMLAN